MKGRYQSHMMRNWYIIGSDAYLPRGKEQSDQIEG